MTELEQSIFSAPFIAFLTFIGAMAWLAICNKKARQQRLAILDKIGDRMKVDRHIGGIILHEFRKVSYERHLLSLVFFCDPMKLYSSDLRGYRT